MCYFTEKRLSNFLLTKKGINEQMEQIFSNSVMYQFVVSLIKNFFELARQKIDGAINYGYKKYIDFSSSLLQLTKKYRKKLEKRISSDDRSLIKKSDNYYRDNKTSKVLHTTLSEYWKDALFNHWFILTHCLILVTIIIVIAPWIGSDCNSESIYEGNYFDDRLDYLRQLRRSLDERTFLRIQEPCRYTSLFSSGKDPLGKLKKRSRILRRKRGYRSFY